MENLLGPAHQELPREQRIIYIHALRLLSVIQTALSLGAGS